MRPRSFIALVALAMLLATLSVTRQDASAVTQPRALERQAIAREIERAVRDAYDMSREDLPARIAALYPDSGRVVSAGGGQVFASRDSVLELNRGFWERVGRNMRDPQWILEQIYVDVVSRDAAVMTAAYRLPHRTPDGRPHELAGAWTALFVRQDGRWVIVQEHLSDLPAGSAPTVDSSQLLVPDDTL